MAALFDRLRATADRLVTKYGTTGEIVRTGSGGMPWEPVAGETAYPCRVVIDQYAAQEIDGTLILTSDAKITIPAVSVTIEPTPADRLRVAGAEYQIVSVSTIRPDGQAIMFEVQGRR